MTVRNHSARRSNRLAIERLETRDNPNGTVAAALSASGTLSLIGDINDNDVRISLTSTGALVEGLNGTTINGSTSTSATLSGSVVNLAANLQGGNDHVSINSATAFTLTGGAAIDLGDGNNTLDLVTNDAINITGNLLVRAGTGLDTVNVRGGTSSSIGGWAAMLLGNGGSTVDIEGVSINGRGVAVIAGTGTDTVTLNNVLITHGAALISGGTDLLTVNLSATDNVAGRLAIGGRSGVDVNIPGGTFGALTVRGGMNADTNVNVTGSATVNSNFDVRGFNVDVESTSGTLEVDNNAIIIARANATLNATGSGLTVGKHLGVIAGNEADINFGTGGAATINGNLVVIGGLGNDSITANGNLTVGHHLGLILRSGNNTVSLLGAGNDLDVNGNLVIITGNDNDTVLLDQVKVGGNTVVHLGGGVDTFTAINGTTFNGQAVIDLGAGADILALANNAGATDGVTFGGRAIINAGAGDDVSLTLGLAGKTNNSVTFNTPGSVLSGGLGIDLFVLADANIINFANLTLFGIP